MTPKEKAKELVQLYSYRIHTSSCIHNNKINAKESALICINEIINEYWSHDTKRRDWWQEVKKEIEKL